MNEGLESLLAFCIAERRVCPQPMRWNELWEMLPQRRRIGNGWEPPPPLILGAWWHASNAQKRARLRQHIEYAAAHGALPQVEDFLRMLVEQEWHHEDE